MVKIDFKERAGTFWSAAIKGSGRARESSFLGRMRKRLLLEELEPRWVPNATQLVFSTPPETLTAGQDSASITIKLLDQNGVPFSPVSPVTVNLSSSNAAGEFLSGGKSISSITILPGSTSGASFQYEDTQAGTPTLTASAGGVASSQQQEMVNPAAASSISVTAPSTARTGTGFKVTGTVEDSFGNVCTDATGALTFSSSNGEVTPTSVSLSKGSATLAVTLDMSGSVTLSATAGSLTGISNYITVVSVRSAKFLMASNTTVISSLNPSLFGDSVTFTATVSSLTGSGTPTGTVQFMVNGANFGFPVLLDSSDVATLTTNALPIGSASVVALYSGDGVFASSSGALTQSVRSATTTTLSSSANPSVFGQSVTFTATVSSATGSGTPTGVVQFMVNGTNIGTVTLDSFDVATLTTSALPIGSASVVALYSGDNTSASSSGALTQSVRSATTTALSSSANPSVVGQSITFTAAVSSATGSGTPTGVVQFLVNGSNIGTVTLDSFDVATLTTNALPIGSASVVALYSGDGVFASSSGALTQSVRSATTTTLSSSANPSVFGQSITFTAAVSSATGSGTPTGVMQFLVNGTNIGTVTLDAFDVATLTTNALPIGPASVVALYSGDGAFASSSGALTQSVRSATTTILSSSVNPSVFGQSITFTAAVSSATGNGRPTGVMQFLVNGTNIGTVTLDSFDVATLTTSALPIGSASVVALYSGDGVFASSSGALTQSVRSATTTILSSSANPSVFGQSITFTAAVSSATGSGTPTGVVQFLVNGTNIGTVTLDSFDVATLSTSALPIGSASVVAMYSGDGAFASSSGALTQSVRSATTTTLHSSVNPSVFGQVATVVATVASVPPGTGTPSQGTVTFFVNNTPQATVTINSSSQASLDLSTLAGGTYTITATYNGDSVAYGPSTSSAALSQTIMADGTTTILTPSISHAGTAIEATFTATVKPVLPGAAVPTGTVTFAITGNNNVTVNLVNGVASLTHTFTTHGVATITATYNPNPATNFTSGAPATLTQVLNGTTTVVSHFVIGIHGAPTGGLTAGQPVTLTATALNALEETIADYAGTIHFTSSDPQAGKPADYTFTTASGGDNGSHTFSIPLKTAGNQTISVSDTHQKKVTGTSSPILVISGINNHLLLTGFPTTDVSGSAHGVTVEVMDQYNNVVRNYTGTVVLSSSDQAATGVPASYNFSSADAGVHTFAGTVLNTVGTQSLSALDNVAGLSSSPYMIQVQPPASLVILGPGTSVVSGIPFFIKVKAFSGTIVDTQFTDTVSFSSSDPQVRPGEPGVLPGPTTFKAGNQGILLFAVMLYTPGEQTITVTDLTNGTVIHAVLSVEVDAPFGYF